MADLQASIEELWERAAELSPADTDAARLVEEAIELLDTGQARVAEVDAATDEVVVHEWLKKSILMLFSLRGMETIETGPFEYADKLPLKHGFAEAGVRALPGASARWGSFLGRGVVLMPSYVNIGAWVGAGLHGRHLGHGGVVRADRRAGAPGGRRGHRRRARAAQRRARRGRGRRLRRAAGAWSPAAPGSAGARCSAPAASSTRPFPSSTPRRARRSPAASCRRGAWPSGPAGGASTPAGSSSCPACS